MVVLFLCRPSGNMYTRVVHLETSHVQYSILQELFSLSNYINGSGGSLKLIFKGPTEINLNRSIRFGTKTTANTFAMGFLKLLNRFQILFHENIYGL